MDDRHFLQVAQNPFAALFPSVEKAEEFRQNASALNVSAKGIIDNDSKPNSINEVQINEEERTWIVNDTLQRVFLITINNDSDRQGKKQHGGLPKRCVYLRNTASTEEGSTLQWTNIDEAIMERLSMTQPRTHVMITGGARITSLTAEVEAGEVSNVKYLASCYKRATEECKKWKEKDLVEIADRAKTLALSYAGTCLLSPEMFSKAVPQKHLFQLMLTMQEDQVISEFIDGLVQEHHEKDDLTSMFSPVLEMLADRCKDISSLLQPDVHNYFELLLFFAKHVPLAEILVSSRVWLPAKLPVGAIQGHTFEKQTLLGFFLALTSMSRDPSKPSEFFQHPTEQSHVEMQATMANLRKHFDTLSEKLHKVVMEIMKKSSFAKHQVLYWIGACLHGNITRKKMMAEFFATTQAQDGFFLNLSTLLLKMCQPFMDPCSPKLLKINPQYCAVKVSFDSIAQEGTALHVVGLDGETRLVVPPDEEDNTLRITPGFGFVTECFFMTHHCLNLGLWKVCEKYRKLMNELAQMQQVYQDATAQGSEGVLIQRLKVQFENSIIKQLSLKTHLLNPSLIELGLRFYIASASWLNQVALAGDSFDEMTSFKEVEIPLPTQTPKGLLFVPEFIVENMADFIIFLRHFSEETLESAGKSLHHLVTFFVIYMGSPERVRNPHLRAKLAETLEALVPIQKSKNSSELLSVPQANMFNRQSAFLQHNVAPAYLPQALLQLFVDIEFTGHSMQFEQKFGYRHHMYSVLKFMWQEDDYKASLLKMGEEAADEKKKKTAIPLFLRFLNLLINDSIFLLDEALQFMAALKKLQAEKDSGEWESLSEQSQQQKQQELQHTSGMARSHNILANETVHALSYLTADIKQPFLIGCMVRRTADMLNYFLLRLVGPKMGELKVKNLSEFHFKPQMLVSDISDIYLNLGEKDSFCRAVATDKRSYSPNLFKQSERVLKLIGRPSSVIFKLNELADRVNEFAQQDEEDDLIEPPEEFLDPITNSLMTDPVILTTSNNIVDRSTICRHLLSDQKDPFNRSPLTLDMLKPHDELRTKIHAWMAEMKAQGKR